MKREIIDSTANFTKWDFINSKNGYALQDEAGNTLNVTRAAILDVEDDDGQKKVSVMVTEDGQYYTAISKSVYEVMGDIIELITDEGIARVKINSRKSKSGRDFLTVFVI